MPPENMAIDMRHLKLKPEEAALLSGELTKPSWQSRNEGIHERVSFEDTIWGFDLAGGSYYHTPLRVTAVKSGSRADKAGIRPGDKLKRINDIETSTLTIQEAHQIILDSGVHLKIAVTAPEDEEDAYYCYQDEFDDGYDSEEERRRLAEEKAKKRQVHARVSHYWSLQWPWVSKRRIIYRESNCFMVPSKFEEKNKSKFPTQPVLKTSEDVVLDSVKSERELREQKDENTLHPTPVMNGNDQPNETANTKPALYSTESMKDTNTAMVNGSSNDVPKLNRNLSQVPEIEEPVQDEEMNSTLEDVTEEVSQIDEDMESKDQSQNDISVDENNVESENVEPDSEIIDSSQQDESMDGKIDETIHSGEVDEDQVINEVLEDENIPKGEEESIIDSILSDGEEVNHSDER